jgi:hypothetical protein
MAFPIRSVVVVAHMKSDTAGLMISFTGAGLTVLVSWAQVELGLFATSLIPTFGVAATRVADTATLTETSWVTANAAAAMIVDMDQVDGRAAAGSIGLAQLDDGTTNNRIAIRLVAVNGQPTATFVAGGVVGFNGNLGVQSFAPRKLGITWDATDFNFAVAGAVVYSTTAHGGLPSGLNRIDLLASTGGSSVKANGWIRGLRGYSLSARFTDPQLQALTS